MSPFGGKKVEELEDIIEERLNKFEQSISARMTPLSEALKRMESRLAEIQALLGTLASQPEVIRSRFAGFLEKAEKISEELDQVRFYENTLLSIQEGLKDIIEALSREREAIKKEIEALLKEKSELAVIRQELKKWGNDLDAKERELAIREAELRALEEKKLDLERRISELESSYLKGLEELGSRLENMFKGFLRDFKIREIRMERLLKKEAELREELSKLREREEAAEELERKVLQLRSELSMLEERKKKLEAEIKDLENKRVGLEKLIAEMRRAVVSP